MHTWGNRYKHTIPKGDPGHLHLGFARWKLAQELAIWPGILNHKISSRSGESMHFVVLPERMFVDICLYLLYILYFYLTNSHLSRPIGPPLTSGDFWFSPRRSSDGFLQNPSGPGHEGPASFTKGGARLGSQEEVPWINGRAGRFCQLWLPDFHDFKEHPKKDEYTFRLRFLQAHTKATCWGDLPSQAIPRLSTWAV